MAADTGRGAEPTWLVEVTTFLRAIEALDLFAAQLRSYEQLANPASYQTALLAHDHLELRLQACRTAGETAHVAQDTLQLSRALGLAVREWQLDRAT